VKDTVVATGTPKRRRDVADEGDRRDKVARDGAKSGRGSGSGSGSSPLATALTQVLAEMRAKTHRDGYALTEDFEALPSRTEYPDYYRDVKAPISLTQIDKRLAAGKYDTVSVFAADMDLLFGNAISYNAPGSDIYNDACTLRKLCTSLLKQVKTEDAPTVPKAVGPRDNVVCVIVCMCVCVCIFSFASGAHRMLLFTLPPFPHPHPNRTDNSSTPWGHTELAPWRSWTVGSGQIGQGGTRAAGVTEGEEEACASASSSV